MPKAPIGESEDPRGCVIEDLEASNPNYASAWEVFVLVHMMIMIRRTMLMLTKGKHNRMTEVFLLILMMVMRRRMMRRRRMMTYAFLPQ